MPFKSAKQAKFMQAIAHGMKMKGKKGPSMMTAKKMVEDAGDYDKKSEKKPGRIPLVSDIIDALGGK